MYSGSESDSRSNSAQQHSVNVDVVIGLEKIDNVEEHLSLVENSRAANICYAFLEHTSSTENNGKVEEKIMQLALHDA